MERDQRKKTIEGERAQVSASVSVGFLLGLLAGIAVFLLLELFGRLLQPGMVTAGNSAVLFAACAVTGSCIAGFVRMARIFKRIRGKK